MTGLGPRRTARQAPTYAGDETVALAMRKATINNIDLRKHTGLTHSGADQRLQCAFKRGRILRVEWGVYAAAHAEYERIGLPTATRKPIAIPLVQLIERMARYRDSIKE